MPLSSEVVLASTVRTMLELLSSGPAEITSTFDPEGSVEDCRRQLTSLFAAGVRPGCFREEWIEWPIDLTDGAAATAADWLIARRLAWPETDEGALFESLGVHFLPTGTRPDGSRRMPRGESSTILQGRSWARALASNPADMRLAAASAAVGLLLETCLPREGDRPRRDGSRWVFPGEVRDVRALLREALCRMLPKDDDVERALALAWDGWSAGVGAEPPVPSRPSRRRPKDRASVDAADVERASPWVALVLELAARARRDGAVPLREVLEPVERADLDEPALVRHAVLVGLAVAGVRPRSVPVDNVMGDALLRRFAELSNDPSAADDAFVPFDSDGDPLDVRHERDGGAGVPLSWFGWLAWRLLHDAGGNHRSETTGTVSVALSVPAAAAVIESHRRAGDWRRRTAFRLDRFYDALDRDASGRPPEHDVRHPSQLERVRTADLLDRPPAAEDLAGSASLAAPDNWGTRGPDTVAAVAAQFLDLGADER